MKIEEKYCTIAVKKNKQGVWKKHPNFKKTKDGRWGSLPKSKANATFIEIPKGMYVVDIDTKKIPKKYQPFVDGLGSPTRETANGYHYDIKSTVPITNHQNIFNDDNFKVDIKTEGGLIFTSYWGNSDHVWYKKVGKIQKDPKYKIFKSLPIEIREPRKPKKTTKTTEGELSVEEVKQHLKKHDVMDYTVEEKWIGMLAAIHAGGGSKCEDVAREWSKGDAGNYDDNEFDKRWTRIVNGEYGDSWTVGTLYGEKQPEASESFGKEEGNVNPISKKDKKKKKGLTLKTYKELSNEKPETLILAGLPVPKSAVIMIAGKGDTGKSFLTLKMAISYLEQNPKEKVLFWFTEDSESTVRSRIKSMGVEKSISKRMRFVSDEIADVKSKALKELKKITNGFGMTVLDPLISFYEGEENNNNEARDFFNRLKLLNGLVVLIHHSSKGGETARGASDFRNGVRMMYKVEKFTKTYRKSTQSWTTEIAEHLHERFVSVDKDNHGHCTTKRFEGVSGENKGYCISLFDMDHNKMKETREDEKAIKEEAANEKGEAVGTGNILLFKSSTIFKAEKTEGKM